MPGMASGTLSRARQEYVDRYGSPEYVWDPGVLAAGANARINLSSQFPLSRKYAPLDTAVVVNNSGEQLLITINGKAAEARTVPAGAIATIDNTSLITFQVTNEDAVSATAANEVNVNFSRAALSADELARRRNSGS